MAWAIFTVLLVLFMAFDFGILWWATFQHTLAVIQAAKENGDA